MKNYTLLLALLFAMDSAPAEQQNRFVSVASEEVRVDVLVTAGGKPLTDLEASDFEIFDNGVRQETTYVKLLQDMPLHAILVFDMSRSISGSLLDDLKSSARGLLADFHEKDRAALITFNHAVTLGSPLTGDLHRIQSALDEARPFGNSSLIDAGYTGLMLAESGTGPPIVIIFSDGLDTSSWLTGDAVLDTAKRTSSVVYAVSTYRLPDKSFLRTLTEYTGGALFETESTSDISAAFLKALKEFRKRYLLTYSPRGVLKSGWHSLEVRVRRPFVEVKTRPGYMRSEASE